MNDWWNRPCGGADVLRLAWPLILSTGSWSLLNFVDRVFLMWYSADAMAATTPAGMMYWSMIAFPLGIASYLNTFVAQYYGAKRFDRIGAVLAQGIWFGFLVTPLFLLAKPLAPVLLQALGHSGKLLEYELAYFGVLTFGAGASVLAAAQSAFFTGRGETRTVMMVDIGGTLFNAVLDYAWIFGKWGFPEWGVHGAAWATVVAQWSKVVVFWWLAQRPSVREQFAVRIFAPLDRDLWIRLFRIGGASAFQMLTEGLAFTMFILFVGQLGSVATAATTLAFSINNVAFVPMIGLGIAVSTLVGQKLGEDRPELAERATWSGLAIALIYTSIFAVVYVGFPQQFFWLHESFADRADIEHIKPTAVIMLRFVAAYCLFDAAQIVFVGALKGAGDMRFVLLTTILLSTCALVAGNLGPSSSEHRLWWWWWICTFWIAALGIVYAVRFVQGKWKQFRVIEQAPVDLASAIDFESAASVPGETGAALVREFPEPRFTAPVESTG